MTRQQVLSRIEVGKGDFVIDIGGGHRPFSRANLVIEKYPFSDSLHRTSAMQFPDVPVIKADALALPVPDGGCDLAFASHIIEHLPDPKGFIDEIKRCSRRVYLEFPARSRELLYAWPFHEWFVEAHGTALTFYRNDLPQLFGSLFHEEYDSALGAWSEARHEYLNTSVHCRSDEITCEFPSETATELVLRDAPHGKAKMDVAKSIHRPQYSLGEIAAFVAQSILPNGAYIWLSRPRMRPTSPVPLPDSVLRRLMCQRCRGTSLNRIADVVACRCGARYTQDRGVFDFDA